MSEKRDRLLEIKQLLEDQIGAVQDALPDALKGKAKHFIDVVFMAVTSSLELQECTLPSLVRALMRSAATGIPASPPLASIEKVRENVGSSDNKIYESWARFNLSYLGLISAAKRCGAVKRVVTDVVCEGEPFDFSRSMEGDFLSHKPHYDRPRDEVQGAYAIYTLPDDATVVEYIHVGELDYIKGLSKAPRGPWANFTNEMRRKTVCKRGLKTLSHDPWLQEIIDYDNEEYDLTLADRQPVPSKLSTSLEDTSEGNSQGGCEDKGLSVRPIADGASA